VKILVSGATGFLGPHLFRRLVDDGHDVTAFHRATSDTSVLAGIPVRRRIGDITDPAALAQAIRGQEAVVHAAAAPSSGAAGLLYQVNIEGTRNVVEACRRQRVARLLHVSSTAAVGIPEDPARPADEQFCFNLEDSPLPYHISKHRAEEVVMRGVAEGQDAVIVNPCGIFGPLGSRYRGGEALERVRRKRIVHYYCGGVCVVHVADVVDGIVAALERGGSGERYILGGENLSFREMAEKTAAVAGLRRVFVPAPPIVTGLAALLGEAWGRLQRRRPWVSHADHYYANRFHFYDSAKARRTLGFCPRGFDAILQDWVRSLARFDESPRNRTGGPVGGDSQSM